MQFIEEFKIFSPTMGEGNNLIDFLNILSLGLVPTETALPLNKRWSRLGTVFIGY